LININEIVDGPGFEDISGVDSVSISWSSCLEFLSILPDAASTTISSASGSLWYLEAC